MPIDPDKLLALAIPEIRQSYGWRDTALYALGVGVGQDPVDERQLAFVDETRLQALPTMASILAHPGFWIRELETGIDWRRVVHAEQSLRVHRPIPAQATVRAVTRVLEIVDKGAGKGALVRYGREILDAGTDTPIATAEQVSICRGAGGFGGSPVASWSPPSSPDRAPDLIREMPTYPQQALVYRLCGDLNPLHIDPGFARKAGFERPILHGLSTYGMAAFCLISSLCDCDPTRFRNMSARFSSPVFPGERIAIDIWRAGPGAAAFRARVGARDAVVLSNGRFEFAA